MHEKINFTKTRPACLFVESEILSLYLYLFIVTFPNMRMC